MADQENKPPFKVEDVDDVRILIKVGDKHYTITPNKTFGRDVGRAIRIELLKLILESHDVVSPSIEEIGDMDLKFFTKPLKE